MSADSPGAERKVLVLGVGNLLLGDEGIGVLAAQRLMATDLSREARIVDGGTGGFHLLDYLLDHPRVIMIDATSDGAPPGTVRRLEPRFAHDFPPTLSAHEIGLRDLIEAAAILGRLPRVDLVTVSIADLQPLTLEISPAVREALPRVEALVREILAAP